MELLQQLLSIDSPAGDEDVMADWLSEWLRRNIADAHLERLGESLVALRGTPRSAVFAHIDTTGFTLGYSGELVRIGGPSPTNGDRLRTLEQDGGVCGVIRVKADREWRFEPNPGHQEPFPGSRLVYAAEWTLDADTITGPYLDNRAGIWAALETLRRSDNVAVAFTACEEHSGKGASICARYLYERLGIRQALISDLTWDTDHVHCGDGVAISLRDSLVPRQRFLRTVRRIAGESGIKHQLEVESAGGSDGGPIQRSGFPIDWVFIGAPEQRPHTASECVRLSDLNAMVDLLAVLVRDLPEN